MNVWKDWRSKTAYLVIAVAWLAAPACGGGGEDDTIEGTNPFSLTSVECEVKKDCGDPDDPDIACIAGKCATRAPSAGSVVGGDPECESRGDCGEPGNPDIACVDGHCVKHPPSGPFGEPPECEARADCGDPGDPDIDCVDGVCVKQGPT